MFTITVCSFSLESFLVFLLFLFALYWQTDCKAQVKNIQTLHIELDFADIGYNFLVGGDGAIYIGVTDLKVFFINFNIYIIVFYF